MHLHAASIGAAVPRENFDATIQSVFDAAVNLRLADENRLITLLISERYELPQGIRVVDQGLPLRSLSPNLRAAARGGILRFDASPLTVDLRGASVWEGRIPPLTSPLEQAASITWRVLNEQQRLKNTELIAADLFQVEQGPLLTRKLSGPVLQLITAAERLDPQAAIDAAQKMIGLGPGVTPSGDDLLIGFMAGLHSTVGNEPERRAFIRAFGEALLALSKHTNEISRTYLYHAVHGQFSSSLIALLEALQVGEEEQLISAAKEAMRVGHSSGMDSVTGLLIALAIWNTSTYSSILPLGNPEGMT